MLEPPILLLRHAAATATGSDDDVALLLLVLLLPSRLQLGRRVVVAQPLYCKLNKAVNPCFEPAAPKTTMQAREHVSGPAACSLRTPVGIRSMFCACSGFFFGVELAASVDLGFRV